MSPPGASVRVMREVPPDDPDAKLPQLVWLYEDGGWQQATDPIREREDGDFLQELTDAGYRDPGRFNRPALEVLYPAAPGHEADGLKLWVRLCGRRPALPSPAKRVTKPLP